MTESTTPKDSLEPVHIDGQLELFGTPDPTLVESQLAKTVLGLSPEAKEIEAQPRSWTLEEFRQAIESRSTTIRSGDRVVGLESRSNFRDLEELVCARMAGLPYGQGVKSQRFASEPLDRMLTPPKFYGELTRGVAVLTPYRSPDDDRIGNPIAKTIHPESGIVLTLGADLKSSGKPAIKSVERTVTYIPALGSTWSKDRIAYGQVYRQPGTRKSIAAAEREVALHTAAAENNAHKLEAKARRHPVSAGLPNLGK